MLSTLGTLAFPIQHVGVAHSSPRYHHALPFMPAVVRLTCCLRTLAGQWPRRSQTGIKPMCDPCTCSADPKSCGGNFSDGICSLLTPKASMLPLATSTH